MLPSNASPVLSGHLARVRDDGQFVEGGLLGARRLSQVTLALALAQPRHGFRVPLGLDRAPPTLLALLLRLRDGRARLRLPEREGGAVGGAERRLEEVNPARPEPSRGVGE